MPEIVSTPSPDEPFSMAGLFMDLAALAAIGLFVTVASAFFLGAG